MRKLNAILLIDDDAVTNYLNQILLEELQVAKEIAICTNGEKALKYLLTVCKSNQSPELILLDLNMPVLDGFGFLEKYKQAHLNEVCKSTIAVLSSSSNPRDQEKVKQTGLAQYLIKPLSAEQLKALLGE